MWTRDIGGNVSNNKRTTSIILDETQPNIGDFTFGLADSTGGSTTDTNSAIFDVSIDTCNDDSTKVLVTESASVPVLTDFTVACSSFSTYTLQDTTQGSHNLYFWVHDIAGNISASYMTSVNFDTIQPGLPGSFSVADDDYGSTAYTNSTTLDYTIDSCNGIDYIFLGEDQTTAPTENDGSWIACATSGNISNLISGSTGAHKVYLWSKDEAGNISPSSSSHTITWDNTAPSAPVATTPSTYATLHTQSNPDTISGTAEANATVVLEDSTNSNTFEVTANGSGNWSYSYTNPNANTTTFINLKARDAAGNESSTSWVQFRHDTVAPTPGSITIDLTDTTANISWSTPGEFADKYFEWGTSLAYGNLEQDAATFASSHSVSLSSLTPNTQYYFRIKSTDQAGNYDVGNDYSGSFWTYIPKTGTISSSETWSSTDTSYMVSGVLTIDTAQTLTINPGVTVMFNSGSSMIIDGTLVARGNSGNHITFRAIEEVTTDFWNTITFTANSPGVSVSGSTYNSGNVFEYVDFKNGGTSNPMIQVTNSGLLLDHVTVRYSGDYTNSASIVEFTADSNLYIWDSDFYNPAKDTIYSTSGSGGVFEFIRSRYENTNTSLYKTAIYVSSSPGSITLQDSYFEGYNGSNSSNERAAVYFNSAGPGSIISGNTFNGSGNNDLGIRVNGTVSIINNLFLLHTSEPPINLGAGSGTSSITNNIFDQGCPCLTLDLNSSAAVVNVSNNVFTGCRVRSDFTPTSPWDNGPGMAINIYRDAINGATVNASYNLLFSNSQTGSNLSLFSLYDKSGVVVNYNYTYNNFINNTVTQAVYNTLASADGSPNLQYNWWGTTVASEIDDLIYDFAEDLSISSVDYSNFLTTPDTSAPISPPQNFAVTDLGGGSVRLDWDAVIESDTDGYIVYYSSTSGYPYDDGTGATEGNSGAIVITNESATTFTINGLTTNQTYYFTVTSYDTGRDLSNDQFDGNESWYSTERSVFTNP